MRIEMHVHTSEGSPCARADAEHIVKAYSEAGYDGIVITNHFDSVLLKDFGKTDTERIERYLLGYRKAKAAGFHYGIQVMPGVEIRLEPGQEDFLIYGIDEDFLFCHPDLCFMNQQAVFELCHSYGAVFYQAHPFRKPCRPQNPEFLDGVEFNQRPYSGNHNEKLSQWVKDYPKLKFISGSDCHDLDQVGSGGIEIEQPVNDVKELTELLKTTQVKLIEQPENTLFEKWRDEKVQKSNCRLLFCSFPKITLLAESHIQSLHSFLPGLQFFLQELPDIRIIFLTQCRLKRHVTAFLILPAIQ